MGLIMVTVCVYVIIGGIDIPEKGVTRSCNVIECSMSTIYGARRCSISSLAGLDGLEMRAAYGLFLVEHGMRLQI